MSYLSSQKPYNILYLLAKGSSTSMGWVETSSLEILMILACRMEDGHFVGKDLKVTRNGRVTTERAVMLAVS